MKENEKSAIRVLDVARHDLRVRKVLENVKGGAVTQLPIYLRRRRCFFRV
jgi:hypothetical protein